ncbi:MAG: Bax inhibitor-1/YccA family protein [Crocinitomicaceae bacterium]
MQFEDHEVIDSQFNAVEASRTFFANVYKYMFLALTVSGLVAYYSAATGWYVNLVFGADGSFSAMGYVIMFAPLALVLLIQSRVNKMSFGSVMLLYIVYSVLIGISLSFIFLIYTSGTIASTFFITAGTFGGMAVLGYTTKADLSKMGSLLYMLFIGIIIASVVNVFMGSEMIDYIISFVGLFVFTGLTAWEMQRLKKVSGNPEVSGELRKKHELMGGLILYILFINLFLSILRFTGD